ncbi:MAG: hydrogenase expression/formation protein HypE [bacterium]|nr:hydrogenase expression/formation protein HypE [bacterium]
MNKQSEIRNPQSAIGKNWQCPIPIQEYPTVLMAHGGGGRLTRMLIERMFLPAFRNSTIETLHDGAVLEIEGLRLAFTTDSFVINPLFFPGGDIGELAVNGTVNDLAMCGARPLYLSLSFILEEGFPMEDLWRVTRSIQAAAEEAEVKVVTGDTKVVDRGKGDGLFINTSGVGLIPEGVEISPQRVCPGDVVLISGAIAVHGIAILSVREGLEFETTLESDTAPLNGLVKALLDSAGPQVHMLRDPTRGGVATTLNEIASSAKVGIMLEEAGIPIRDEVRGACEILGLDPLYVANEGKYLAIVAPEAADAALEAMRAHPLGREAAIIGHVVEEHAGTVILRSQVGGKRVVDMLSGEQLPRIC